jgi:glc operon protein GlcG
LPELIHHNRSQPERKTTMSLKRLILSAIASVFTAFALLATAQTPPYGAPISVESAKKAAAAAVAEARKNNLTMTIAIADIGGDLVYLEKMDGAFTGSVNVAVSKARSAALFKRPTKTFEDRLVAGGTPLLSLQGAVLLGGGIPIVMDGKIVGAIGVSGGIGPQDLGVAEAGIGALK